MGKTKFAWGSLIALLGLGLLSTACGGTGGAHEESSGVIAELKSDAPRVTAAVGESSRASQGEQAFGFRFLQALDADSNVTFSPHSISSAFAMLSGAAQGQTLTELEQVLQFGTVDDAFHRSQDALELGLASRNRAAIDQTNQKVAAQILTESNDIWVRDDVPPDGAYLDTLARYYGVGVHQADFGTQPEAARGAINAKVSRDTHDLISQLIPPGVITSDTVSVLTNALYFKAPWADPLSAPQPGDFHALNGSTETAQLLRGQATRAYYEGQGFVSVAMPYFGQELEMLLVVPDAGQYATVRSQMTSDALSQIVASRKPELVDLTLPKFELNSVVPAKQILQELGMATPFDQKAAQFPGFPPGKYDNTYVSDVLHQATVKVDENGAEASAATAIVVDGFTSIAVEPPPMPKVVTVDRPFLFVIRDNPTGAVLFIGQVVTL